MPAAARDGLQIECAFDERTACQLGGHVAALKSSTMWNRYLLERSVMRWM
jgi:hypothetical protein